MGGCENDGPFLGTLNIRCRIIIGIQKGTIILTTIHIVSGCSGDIFDEGAGRRSTFGGGSDSRWGLTEGRTREVPPWESVRVSKQIWAPLWNPRFPMIAILVKMLGSIYWAPSHVCLGTAMVPTHVP